MREKLVYILKGVLFAYILTAVLLLIMALGLYFVGMSEKMVHILITAVYVISTFTAGFMLGKKLQNKKFLWGFMAGAAYFLILVLVSLVANGAEQGLSDSLGTTMILCMAGGMLGGMLS